MDHDSCVNILAVFLDMCGKTDPSSWHLAFSCLCLRQNVEQTPETTQRECQHHTCPSFPSSTKVMTAAQPIWWIWLKWNLLRPHVLGMGSEAAHIPSSCHGSEPKKQCPSLVGLEETETCQVKLFMSTARGPRLGTSKGSIPSPRVNKPRTDGCTENQDIWVYGAASFKALFWDLLGIQRSISYGLCPKSSQQFWKKNK